MPDYERSTETLRFEAVQLASISGKGRIYLIQQCGDRADLQQTCSMHGNNAQYLAFRPTNWKLDQGFEATSRDLRLDLPDYAMLVRPIENTENELPLLIGDFVSKRRFYDQGASSIRIWFESSSVSDFRFEKNRQPILVGASQVIDIQFMRPTVRCDTTVTRYRIDTMVLPLPQTINSHEGPTKTVRSCTSA